MNMPENLYLEFDAFLRSIKQNLDGSFGVLLGAGASISSGIQSANDCIWAVSYTHLTLPTKA